MAAYSYTYNQPIVVDSFQPFQPDCGQTATPYTNPHIVNAHRYPYAYANTPPLTNPNIVNYNNVPVVNGLSPHRGPVAYAHSGYRPIVNPYPQISPCAPCEPKREIYPPPRCNPLIKAEYGPHAGPYVAAHPALHPGSYVEPYNGPIGSPIGPPIRSRCRSNVRPRSAPSVIVNGQPVVGEYYVNPGLSYGTGYGEVVRGGYSAYGGRGVIAYPTTHSIPGPYLQSYINSPRMTYPY